MHRQVIRDTISVISVIRHRASCSRTLPPRYRWSHWSRAAQCAGRGYHVQHQQQPLHAARCQGQARLDQATRQLRPILRQWQRQPRRQWQPRRKRQPRRQRPARREWSESDESEACPTRRPRHRSCRYNSSDRRLGRWVCQPREPGCQHDNVHKCQRRLRHRRQELQKHGCQHNKCRDEYYWEELHGQQRGRCSELRDQHWERRERGRDQGWGRGGRGWGWGHGRERVRECGH